MTRLLGLLLCLQLSGCADDLVLPPAAPLSVGEDKIQQLYGAQQGPHEVASTKTLSLPQSDSSLELSLYYPQKGEGYPLLLFSHGNWSDRHSYDRLIHHWVSHGYVVIATDHADCCSPVKGIFNSLRYGQLGLINRRVAELHRLLEGVPELESLHPPFQGKTDTDRVAAVGHSFGAFSAQQMGGASALDTETGEYAYLPVQAIDAVVAISPPGPMFDTITAESWRGLKAPTLITTGTWDVQKGFWEDYRLHLMSFDNSPPGNKYALVTQGADHYLGNLICRTQRDHPPQEDALTMVKIATTAFLDVQLKGLSEAQRILDFDALDKATQGFARVSQR